MGKLGYVLRKPEFQAYLANLPTTTFRALIVEGDDSEVRAVVTTQEGSNPPVLKRSPEEKK